MPASFSCSDDIHVAAPPDTVWAFASDFSRYSEWVKDTVEVTGGDGTAALGAFYTERNRVAGPLILPARWVVTEYDADARHQRHEADDSPGVRDLWLTMDVTPEADGSRFVLALGGTVAMGPLSGVVARSLQRTLSRTNPANLRTFARMAAAMSAART